MRWSVSGMAAVISRNGYTGDDLSVPVLGVNRSVQVKCRATASANCIPGSKAETSRSSRPIAAIRS